MPENLPYLEAELFVPTIPSGNKKLRRGVAKALAESSGKLLS